MPKFAMGERVHILVPLGVNRAKGPVWADGFVYDYLPEREHCWHVRPIGWKLDQAGIAYSDKELGGLVCPIE